MSTLDIVCSGPPGPDCKLVEVERDGRSVNVGEWVEREDGLFALRLEVPTVAPVASPEAHEAAVDRFALNLGQQRFLDALDATVETHRASVPGARVVFRPNSKGELVYAVIVPGWFPPGR